MYAIWSEITLALNLLCFGGRVVYVHRPSIQDKEKFLKMEAASAPEINTKKRYARKQENPFKSSTQNFVLNSTSCFALQMFKSLLVTLHVTSNFPTCLEVNTLLTYFDHRFIWKCCTNWPLLLPGTLIMLHAISVNDLLQLTCFVPALPLQCSLCCLQCPACFFQGTTLTLQSVLFAILDICFLPCTTLHYRSCSILTMPCVFLLGHYHYSPVCAVYYTLSVSSQALGHKCVESGSMSQLCCRIISGSQSEHNCAMFGGSQ